MEPENNTMGPTALPWRSSAADLAEGQNGAEFGRNGFPPRVTPEKFKEALQSKARGVLQKRIPSSRTHKIKEFEEAHFAADS